MGLAKNGSIYLLQLLLLSATVGLIDITNGLPLAFARVDDMPKDSLTFYIYGPPSSIDWSSPTSMTQTAVSNTISGKPHAIGHVQVGLQCEGEKPVWTGQTSYGSDVEQSLIKHPIIYDLLLTDDWLGVLDSRIEVIHDIEMARKNGNTGYIRFLLHPQTCQRLSQYFKDYKKMGLHLNYGGLASNPLKNPEQGAGCAMFGVNFLKVAGLFTEQMQKEWTQSLLIPPADQPCTQCPTNLQLLLGVKLDWPKAHEPHQQLIFFNPEVMYNSLIHHANALDHSPLFQTLSPVRISLVQDKDDKNIVGLEVDVHTQSHPAQTFIPEFDPQKLSPEVVARRQMASVAQEAKKIFNGWGPTGHCEELRNAPVGAKYRTSQNSRCKKGSEWWPGCDLEQPSIADSCQMWFNEMTD